MSVAVSVIIPVFNRLRFCGDWWVLSGTIANTVSA